MNQQLVNLFTNINYTFKNWRAVIESLLESLPTMFAENKAIESVLGAVVGAVHMALVWFTEIISNCVFYHNIEIILI